MRCFRCPKCLRMPEKSGRLKDLLGMGEMSRKWNLGKALVAEAIGTLFITYFGCISCLSPPLPGGTKDLVEISLAFGFVVAVAVQAVGHMSGGNLNPAVTCALLITGRITIIRAILYILAQCIGAIGGAAIVYALTPSGAAEALGRTSLSTNVTPVQGLFVEFMLGFLLIFVIFGVIDPNKPDSKIPAPLMIGLAVAVGHLSSVQYTGSSMNPARSLGPAVITNNWADHWVYWLGPILGGVVAAILYTTVLSAPQAEYSPVAADAATEMKRMGKTGSDRA